MPALPLAVWTSRDKKISAKEPRWTVSGGPWVEGTKGVIREEDQNLQSSPFPTIHGSAWKVNSPKFARNSPPVHRRSLWYLGGGGLTLERLLLLSRVAHRFPRTHPALLPLFIQARGRGVLRTSPLRSSEKFGASLVLRHVFVPWSTYIPLRQEYAAFVTWPAEAA